MQRKGEDQPEPVDVFTGPACDIVLFGENSLDFVARTAGRSSTTAGKRVLSGFDVYAGGQAATAAVGCARQGWRARYAGLFGSDGWALRVEEALLRESVDVLPIRIADVSNRLAVVMVDETGDRTVYEYRDARLRCADPQRVCQAVVQARLALVDATDLPAATEIAGAARQAGVVTIVDVDRVEPGTSELLALIDLLVAPEEFVTAYTGCAGLGAGLRALAEECRSTAVIATRGAGGSLAWVDGREIVTPGFRVPVADTTGAGDAFRAGLCSAWLGQASTAHERARNWAGLLRWANATAALNCRARGAQTGLPSRAEVAALVAEGPAG